MIVDALAAPDESGFSAIDQNLGRQRAAVVVGRHGRSVSARIEDGEQVAYLEGVSRRSCAKASVLSQTGPTMS